MPLHHVDATCPSCGRKNDCQHNAWQGQGRAPSEGALSLCVYCGEFGLWTDQGLRRLQPGEWDALPLRDRAALTSLKMGWLLGKTQRAQEEAQRN